MNYWWKNFNKVNFEDERHFFEQSEKSLNGPRGKESTEVRITQNKERFCVFTNICSLLIGKDGHACQNISIKFPFVLLVPVLL